MRIVLLLSALCALCGCQIFVASAFPDYPTLISARRSLATDIMAADAGSYTLSTVTTGWGDLVFLASSQPTAAPALFVLDQDLRVLQKFAYTDLAAIYGGPIPDSPRAILGVTGDCVILGLESVPTSSGLTGLVFLGENPKAGSFGFSVPAADNVAGFWTSGDLLAYYIYSPWAAGAFRGNFNISGGALNFNLAGVYSDPARSDVLLILEETSGAKEYYLLLTRSDFIAGLLWPFMNFYPYFTTPRFDRGLVGYEQGGIIALQKSASGSGSRFVRFDMTGNTLPDSIAFSGSTDMQLATRIAGGWYYTFDRTTRSVNKVSAWWKQ